MEEDWDYLQRYFKHAGRKVSRGITEVSKPRAIGPLNTTPGTKAIIGRDEALNSSTRIR
ncbi:hypothetical protein TSTA_110100 [Talaromyces stipitatus ATCC 10500]|uniref:Uncharacterized protein n=1 Tax=Talaromyces stipitatus (strain ATCC 10500 / CBS 375.48 / QM 6759 / NRRL 1006) TaxID=441959 RepID=B8MUY9_TALSN|nr:uncharacterized protein TSTA_110100 [Talaromyces stipitatus ATCC 10500]EED11830.1 hypothetical protein TSTA_110100 [Talaromyces stipitatus ATCC 10500]